jgi:hypothetical protein
MAVRAEATRSNLVRRAFRLEWLTAAWMAVEAAVAIGSGIAAQSLSLVAFGADSLIELASAGVLLWRLTIELRQGAEFPEAVERVIAWQVPASTILLNGQSTAGHEMPFEHLAAPAAFQANDIIAVDGSPDRHCGRSLFVEFGYRFTKAGEGLMHGRD